MLTLPDPKHEAFATLRASGHDLASAYVHAGYSVKNIKERSRKLVRNPDIQARIEYLKTCLPRINQLHEHHCPTLLLMPETRHEMLVWLWQVMNGTRQIKPAQMRAATLYSRLQGWHLAKLLPQAQAQAQVQAGCPNITPAAADPAPIPSSTLTEDEKVFLASSNRENIAHERTLMPRSPESLARYQSILANLAHPACREDAFGRPLPDEISLSTSTPTAASPASSPTSPNPPIDQSLAAATALPASSTNPPIQQSTPTPTPAPVASPTSNHPSIHQSPAATALPASSNNPPIQQSPAVAPASSTNPLIQPSINPQLNPHPKPLTLNPLPPRLPQPRIFLHSPRYMERTRLACRQPRPAAVRS